VTRQKLTRTLQLAINEAMDGRVYGAVEIEFRDGKATFLRTNRQEKLDETENRYGQYRR
jgi:hypothetical protein